MVLVIAVSRENAMRWVTVIGLRLRSHSKPFQVVLFDDQMPGINGSEFMQRMGLGPASGTATIIMLSSANGSSGSPHRSSIENVSRSEWLRSRYLNQTTPATS